MATTIDKLDKLRAAVGGVSVTSVTPFDKASLALDEAGARRNLEVLAGSKIASIIPVGNTGEFHSLTSDEMQAMVRLTVEGVSPDQAVMVGIGGALHSAIEMAQFAEAAGATGIMIHEPSHTFATEDGIEDYYRAISASVSFGIALYKRSPRVTDRLLIKVTREIENIVAVKYAVNEVAAYVELVTAMGDNAVCACGTAERWALSFASAGTTGFTSGIGNFAPDTVTNFWQALKDSPVSAEARRQWEPLAAIERLRARNGSALNVPVIKRAMELMDLSAGPPRPPLSVLAQETVAELKPLLDAVTGLNAVTGA